MVMARDSAMSAAVRICAAVSVVAAALTMVGTLLLQPMAMEAVAAPRPNMPAPTRKERRLVMLSICSGVTSMSAMVRSPCKGSAICLCLGSVAAGEWGRYRQRVLAMLMEAILFVSRIVAWRDANIGLTCE